MWDLLDGKLASLGAHPFALWVALGTVAIKIFLFFYVRKLGRETHNPIVDALAYDHRNDIFSASAASLGSAERPGWTLWLVRLCALLILRTGIFILRESSVELMDAVPSRELAKQIVSLLNDLKGVKQLEELQAHRFGPHIVMNLMIGVDGKLTVRQGDRIATGVEKLIYDSIPSILSVHVHYHPADKGHENMTIEEILSQSRQHVSPHQPDYDE